MSLHKEWEARWPSMEHKFVMGSFTSQRSKPLALGCVIMNWEDVWIKMRRFLLPNCHSSSSLVVPIAIASLSADMISQFVYFYYSHGVGIYQSQLRHLKQASLRIGRLAQIAHVLHKIRDYKAILCNFFSFISCLYFSRDFVRCRNGLVEVLI